MDQKINDFLNDIKDGSFSLIRGELVSFVNGIKTQSDEFSKRQHAKLEKYMLQLATGQITKQQFQDAMMDLKTAADMEITKAKVESKASAQRISEGLNKLVINGLLKAIPG